MVSEHIPSGGSAQARGQPNSWALQSLLNWDRKHGLGSSSCLISPASLRLLEPGYYQDGEFGIRLEDVVVVVEAKTKVNCC